MDHRFDTYAPVISSNDVEEYESYTESSEESEASVEEEPTTTSDVVIEFGSSAPPPPPAQTESNKDTVQVKKQEKQATYERFTLDNWISFFGVYFPRNKSTNIEHVANLFLRNRRRKRS